MKRAKRILLIISFFLILLVLNKEGVALGAEPPVEQGYIETKDWSFSTENKTAIILEYHGEATNVIIPSQIDGYTITGIGKEAFKNSSVTSVTIPDTITNIDIYAFSDCNN